jgi:glycine cleavage system regulatory protein
MQTHLVLTVIGRDRPGLVSAVSETVAAGGGNWLDTRMASLAGQFAGILLVEVAREKADALVEALHKLEGQGLRLLIEKSADGDAHAGSRATLDLLGLDRPGIVREISRALAAHQVSIAELETEQVSGSFSGEPMFKAHAALNIPEGLDMAALRASLEDIASELMVDLELEGA